MLTRELSDPLGAKLVNLGPRLLHTALITTLRFSCTFPATQPFLRTLPRLQKGKVPCKRAFTYFLVVVVFRIRFPGASAAFRFGLVNPDHRILIIPDFGLVSFFFSFCILVIKVDAEWPSKNPLAKIQNILSLISKKPPVTFYYTINTNKSRKASPLVPLTQTSKVNPNYVAIPQIHRKERQIRSLIDRRKREI